MLAATMLSLWHSYLSAWITLCISAGLWSNGRARPSSTEVESGTREEINLVTRGGYGHFWMYFYPLYFGKDWRFINREDNYGKRFLG